MKAKKKKIESLKPEDIGVDFVRNFNASVLTSDSSTGGSVSD